jgi:hypothetical protein
MKIRKAHILVRHFHNMEDDSAGIFYTEEGGGVDWLSDVIQDTVGLFLNNSQEFRRLGGQTYNEQQRRVLLEMPMDSLVGLFRGPERKECTGVLIVYDCWKHLVVTSYPCAPRPRDLQPEDDDGWLSS